MTDNEDLLNETVLPEDLKKYEKVYHEQLHAGSVTRQAQFNYAWCLVRSKFPVDIRKGIILLEELFRSAADREDERRDYLYYLALGNCRIKEFSTALQYTSAFLQIEPGNVQVKNLEETIRKKMEKGGSSATSTNLTKIYKEIQDFKECGMLRPFGLPLREKLKK